MTSLSLLFSVSYCGAGSAVQLGDAVRSAWNSDAFSFDVWFVVLPPRLSYANGADCSVLMGAQTSQWPRVDLLDGACHSFVYVDRLGNLHCSMTTESPCVGSQLQYERWYHVALSFRRSSDNWSRGEQRVFVDGELVHASEGSMHPRWRFLNFAQLGSGCLDSSRAQSVGISHRGARWCGFNGVVDDCRFWRGALSDAQLKLLHCGEEDQVVNAGASCAWSLKQDADAKYYGSSFALVRSTRPRERCYIEASPPDAVSHV